MMDDPVTRRMLVEALDAMQQEARKRSAIDVRMDIAEVLDAGLSAINVVPSGTTPVGWSWSADDQFVLDTLDSVGGAVGGGWTVLVGARDIARRYKALGRPR